MYMYQQQQHYTQQDTPHIHPLTDHAVQCYNIDEYDAKFPLDDTLTIICLQAFGRVFEFHVPKLFWAIKIIRYSGLTS